MESFPRGTSFLKALRHGQSGCLVLDIRMPGMSGLDLQDELHRRKITIPIVFLTGHGDVPMAVR
ncbi:MAG: response regulator, partial [Propionivibrio sp.]|uniref:response regulator transcription factor n=1 Tax=Propionivibrio sp. TaxID=2212460 RepID=UPI001A3F42C5